MTFIRITSRLALACVISLGAGCATTGHVSGNRVSSRPAAASVDAGADWHWNISGDNAVRPVQVFSIKHTTYMQMRGGQLIPAVLVDGSPVPFTISPPYLVIQGIPDTINLVADGYRAIVTHRGPVTMPEPPRDAGDRVRRVGSADAQTIPLKAGHFESVVDHSVRTIKRPKIDIRQSLAAATTEKKDAAARVWRIDPQQKLLSHALRDWSKDAGLRLVWKSDVDVPITGHAMYGDHGFLSAVSHLLADASTKQYRFFYSVADGAVTVVAVRFHAS